MASQKLLKQSTFDNYVSQSMEDGMTVEEASLDAEETFKESGYDCSGIFMANNIDDMKAKAALDANINIVEKCANGFETYINCSFALQGIRQVLSNDKSSAVRCGSWKLCEGRNLLTLLIRILNLQEKIDKDENDDDDTSLDDIKYKFHLTLDMLIYLSEEGTSFVRDYNSLILISSETMHELILSLQFIPSNDSTILTKYFKFIKILLNENAFNISVLKEMEGISTMTSLVTTRGFDIEILDVVRSLY